MGMFAVVVCAIVVAFLLAMALLAMADAIGTLVRDGLRMHETMRQIERILDSLDARERWLHGDPDEDDEVDLTPEPLGRTVPK